MKVARIGLMVVTVLAACGSLPSSSRSEAAAPTGGEGVAIFAGGCFWCMEPPFEKLKGVREVISGYTGGSEVDPTYEEVSSGQTGHVEAVRVLFDSGVVSYETLLEVFWRSIDPTDDGGQFADRGTQYKTAIFVLNSHQREVAEKSKQKLGESGIFSKPIVTPIRQAGPFYRAEEYHQDYYKKNPHHYNRYRVGSGRGPFLDSVWKDRPMSNGTAFTKPPDSVLRTQLTPLQYRVTQENGTERPFSNEYWDNKAEGIYVDVVSGEPLFASTHKYESGSGWPSFTQPLVGKNVVERRDNSAGMVRIEIRSKHGDSHLGHVFPDGPQPTGLRYCINSAALRFIPKEDLEKEGYREFKHLF